jgi:hypothetical protein
VRRLLAWRCGGLCILLGLSAAGRAEAADPAPLSALSFLVGTWAAEGGGEPGRSTGTFSFEWAAGGRSLLRQNQATTPSTRHEDVMLVYALADSIRALYADSEGHVIDYSAAVVRTPPKVVFESAGPGPRFRLWYELRSDSTLATGFQVAAPGEREFKTYLEGVAHRQRER